MSGITADVERLKPLDKDKYLFREIRFGERGGAKITEVEEGLL